MSLLVIDVCCLDQDKQDFQDFYFLPQIQNWNKQEALMATMTLIFVSWYSARK